MFDTIKVPVSYLRNVLDKKDEKYFDKFDRAFDIYFRGIKSMDDILKMLIPDDWVRQKFEKELSKEDLEKINSLEANIGSKDKELTDQKKESQEYIDISNDRLTDLLSRLSLVN